MLRVASRVVTAAVCAALWSGPSLAVELPPEEVQEGFVPLFNGKNLDGWIGDTKGYVAQDGILVCQPGGGLFTEKEYANFIFRFEFKLPPGANNGVGIRTPAEGGDPAYIGMEIQILDDGHPKYDWIKPYQAHGSIYGVVPAKRGVLKPAGEWNTEEIVAQGSKIKVTVNGTVVVDADIAGIKETVDGRPHPGLHNEKGHIGFLGHGDRVEFRNIRIKPLP